MGWGWSGGGLGLAAEGVGVASAEAGFFSGGKRGVWEGEGVSGEGDWGGRNCWRKDAWCLCQD